jgi:hypothetical protein
MQQQTAVKNADLDLTPFRRSPDEVMRLARMGSFHRSRLSFMPTLLRQMIRERWTFERSAWEIDATGVGYAVYRAKGPQRTYSLVAFAHNLPDEMRSDRVIATAWDATFTLFDGEPTVQDVERLRANVPKQEAGRVSDSELTLARANRSVRLWAHVVDSLAAGRQPELEQIEAVGYLMRTTAVYGSGKFGAADRALIAGRPEFRGPFRAEMLTVWLIRTFTVDLVEQLARTKGGANAVTIEPALRRRLGVGNSTGLGMAPFLMNHPTLINNWVAAREEALARVRSLDAAQPGAVAEFSRQFEEARLNALNWHSEHSIQVKKIQQLNADLEQIAAHLKTGVLQQPYPWDSLYKWAARSLSLEGQEQLVSLLIDAHGELVDDLAATMDADEVGSFRIDGGMSVGRLLDILTEQYGWVRGIDFSRQEARARFWYVSEEKLEPRLGQREREPGAELEQPLGVAFDVSQMWLGLDKWDRQTRVAEFLLAHPEHRHTVRRVQIVASHPFSEIRDNLTSAEMLPIDLLRCKLSFFGATKFDPRSDRWVRINMYADAPYPHEISAPLQA